MKRSRKGDLTESKIRTKFIEKGYNVSIPLHTDVPYDLLIEKEGYIEKVQCKTGRLSDGLIIISVKSNNGRWYDSDKSRNYKGLVDYIASYCRDTDSCYLIPISEVGVSNFKIRVEKPKKKDRRINLEKDFIM